MGMKKGLLIFTGILVLFILVVLLAPFFVDLNKYKDTILSQIEPYVPRKVDFQNIELTVFPGLGAELQGLTVSENPAFPDRDFITLERLQIRLQVLPLLKKQIKVKKAVLEKPVVYIEKNKEGVFNFSDLAGGEGPATGEAMDPASEVEAPPREAEGSQGTSSGPEEEKGPGILAWFLVNEMRIKQGTVSYQDAVLFPNAEPHVIRNLDLVVNDLSLQRPVSVELAASLLEASDQNLRLTGTVGPVGEALQVERTPFELRLSLQSLPMETIGKAFLPASPLQIRAGEGSLEMDAKGSLDDRIEVQSELEMKALVLQETVEEGEGKKTEALQGVLSEKAVLTYAEQKVDLQSVAVSLNGNRLVLKGKVRGFLETPHWDLDLKSEGLNPDSLLRLFPMFVQSVPPDLRLEGPAEVTMQSSGSTEKMRFAARVDMNNMGILYQDVFRKSAGIPLSLECKGEKEGSRYKLEDLSLVLHQLALNVSGEVVTEKTTRFGLLAQTRPVSLKGWGGLVPMLEPYHLDGSFFLRSSLRGNLEDASINTQISSDRIGFRLPPSEAQKKAGTPGDPGVLEAVALEVQTKKKKEKVQASGKVKVKKGEVKAVAFQGLLSSLRVAQDRLTIAGLDIQVFKGAVHGSGYYHMKNGQWSFKPVVKGIDAGAALDTLTEYKDMFSGTFSGKVHAQGDTRKKGPGALRANGKFRLSQGELKNFDLVGEVLNALFQVKGVTQFLGGMKGDVGRHVSTRFEWLEGTFDMKGKTLLFDPLQLHNVHTSHVTDSDALVDGKVALDADLLDLKGKVILSKRHSRELAGQAEVLNALLNADKRMVLPVTLKGNLQKPVPSLDTEYVVGAISRHYMKKGEDKLRKELGLPAGKGGGEPVEDLLKGLFR